MFCLLPDGKSSESEFLLQALSTSSIVVGGNIAGVATAIAFEDRSSILMWMVAFLASTAL
jgi:Na+/alanine symporter